MTFVWITAILMTIPADDKYDQADNNDSDVNNNNNNNNNNNDNDITSSSL